MKKIYLPFAILTLALVSCSTTTSQISSSIETSSSPTSTPISSTSSESPIVSSEPNLDSTASNPTSSDISSESTSSSPTSSIDSPLTWDDKTDTFIRRCLDGQTLPAFDIGLDLSLLGGQSQLIITTTQEGNYDDVVLPVLDTLQEAGFVDNTDNYVDLAEGEHILKGRFNDVNIQIDLALAGNVLTQANNYTPTSYSTTTGYLYLFANSQVVITSFPEDDLKILLDAGAYHDIGRVSDREDSTHGLTSAYFYESKNVFRDEEIYHDKTNFAILKAITDYHSQNEIDNPNVIKNNAYMYDIDDKNYERYTLLANILKDADALDRKRFPDYDPAGLNTDYLRFKESVNLVNFAFCV